MQQSCIGWGRYASGLAIRSAAYGVWCYAPPLRIATAARFTLVALTPNLYIANHFVNNAHLVGIVKVVEVSSVRQV